MKLRGWRRSGRALNPFLTRVFTLLELAECAGQGASLSGHFAAEEAVAKALGSGIGPISSQGMEIQRRPNGEPCLQLYGKALVLAHSLGLDTWSVSISHSQEYAIRSRLPPAQVGGRNLFEL